MIQGYLHPFIAISATTCLLSVCRHLSLSQQDEANEPNEPNDKNHIPSPFSRSFRRYLLSPAFVLPYFSMSRFN